MSYKITPKISESSSRLLDAGGLTGPQALNYDPVTGDFDLTKTSSTGDFIHNLVIYVDPNGDDTTGEFGNRSKPFRTPVAALFTAYSKMNGLFAVPSEFYVPLMEGVTPLKEFWNRITIEIFPGFYDASVDLAWLNSEHAIVDTNANLMYDYIDWYCHPGAVMLGYIFDDTYNYFDVLGLPSVCNVYGEGSWVGYQTDAPATHWIYLAVNESRLYFKARQSTMQFYIAGEATLDYHLHTLIVEASGKLVGSGLEQGVVNFTADKVIWRTNRLQGNANSWQFLYQGGGTLNIYVKEYYGNNIPTPAAYATWVGQYQGGTGPNYYDWQFFKDIPTGPGPKFAYIEEFDTTHPTVSNIRIDKGEFSSSTLIYILNVEGGVVNFYPGNLDVYVNVITEGAKAYAYLLGGPYYAGAPMKFSSYGGKINLTADTILYSGTKAYGVYIYDDPQIYIGGTIFDNTVKSGANYENTYGVYFDGPAASTYQTGSLILDGVKFHTGATGATYTDGRYTFAVVGASSMDVKLYNNCFSNLNPIGSTGGSVVNLIPGTSMIIDSNVQII